MIIILYNDPIPYFVCLAVDIVKEVGCPNLKVQLDLYHAQRTHGNITQTLQDYLQYIGIYITDI